ncbi:prephenate dehydrogenase [Virgibacillus profundi]|uniref:Prephenate dehydrogenase n=1 Tax=Virgibacillus profundi TaxID=2024555 RepID=A0A2A2ID35_9BACI|nr:prephenate dehydrogenase [Virgibacillus profundi]PAV29492.1 prephenate dehydrogenase [Virgibacillus profundi]PXY53661.1 prephenate dehydrogenase [Virgibacillus profundi]
MKRTIVIAGLGLIGGSLAKGMAVSDENHIIGYDVSNETLDYALANKIIHEPATDFTKAAQQADFIILAAPISETIRLMEKLNTITLGKNTIVSDVSSVKSSIIEAANKFTNDNITFIGGHPMSGSHKKGVQAAKAHLFENAIYVLTPAINSTPAKIDLLKDVLQHTKSKFIVLNSDEHDEMTGVVSHFPHLIASSLVHQARKWEETHAYLPNLAAGGFRDITRIASSNPKLWQDIFFHNGNKMSKLLEEWITEMRYLKNLVDKKDKEDMISYLDMAKCYRDGLGTEEKGVIPSFYDIYVDIRDQTGALASVTQILANENISINNIQILEIREGITGALRLSLASKDTQKESYNLLKNHGYEIMIQR